MYGRLGGSHRRDSGAMDRVFRLIAVLLLSWVAFPVLAATNCPAGSNGGPPYACGDQGGAYAACKSAATAYTGSKSQACTELVNTTGTGRYTCTRAGSASGCDTAGAYYFFPVAATCASRADEYGWMPPGGTVGESVCHDGCVYGYVLDASGNFFAPNGNTCTVTEMPPPELDTDGDGVPDDDDAFPTDPNESQDTDGDGIGDNADHSPDDADNGEDDGEGNESDNTATGGGDCNAPPACKGDGIACNTNYQIWKHRCDTWGTVTGDPTVCNAAYSCTGPAHQCAQIALLRKTACSNLINGNVDTDGDGFGVGDKSNLAAIKDAVTAESVDAGEAPDMPWIDGDGESVTWSSGLGGGSCPAPISRTVSIGGYSQAIEFSFSPICQFSLLIQAIALTGAAIVSAYIISGVRK